MGEVLLARDIEFILSEQSIITGGSYLFDGENIISILHQQERLADRIIFDSQLSGLSSLIHLDWREKNYSKVSVPLPPVVLFVESMHPDEDESSKIFGRVISSQLSFPHFEIMNPYNRALIQKRRGTLEWIENISTLPDITQTFDLDIQASVMGMASVTGDESDDYTQLAYLRNEFIVISDLYTQGRIEEAQEKFNHILPELEDLQKGTTFSKNGPVWKLGKKINLNREFPFTNSNFYWEKIQTKLKYPEAKLLSKFIQDHPTVRILNTIHEDSTCSGDGLNERDGFYMYYTCENVMTDENLYLVRKVHSQLIKHLEIQGFPVFDGIDDPSDPTLGLRVEKGLCISSPDESNLQGSLEDFVIHLHRQGLSQIECAFTFEIPGGLSLIRKKQLLDIVRQYFIEPFYREYCT